MPTWLIAYQRRTGDLLRFEEFADPAKANRERFKAERERGGGYEARDLELVTISAGSLEILKRGHGKYFAKSDAAADEHSRLSQEIENSPADC